MSESDRITGERKTIEEKKQEIKEVMTKVEEIKSKIKEAESNSNNDNNRTQINQAVENELTMQRKRKGRNEEIRLEGLLGYSKHIKIKDSVESAWAFVKGFFEVFKEHRESDSPLAPPKGDLKQKIFEKISTEITKPGVTISKDVAPYLLKFLSSLYDEEAKAISLLEVDDWISLYYLNDVLARRLRRVIEDVLEAEDRVQLEEFGKLLSQVKERLARAGLGNILEDERSMLVEAIRGRSRGALKLEGEEIKKLNEYWTRILKAQMFARQNAGVISDSQQREQRLKEIEKQIEMVDLFLFVDNKVEEIKRIIEDWARAGLIPEDEIDNVGIKDSELEEFKMLNKIVITEEEMFLNTYLENPYYNLRALNIQAEDFTRLSYRNVVMHFSEIFEWDREREKLIMKNDVLYVEAIHVLYRILRSVARYPQEEWSRSFDQTMEGMAIKLLRFSVTRTMMKVDEGFFDTAIEGFLSEQGVQVRPEMLDRAKRDVKEMMAKLRVLIDEEFSAQVFSHEFFRLFITDQLRDLRDLQKMYQQFGANKATAVFGGLHKELIDLAARTFEGWLQHVIARNGNVIGPELFASIFTKQDLTYSHHAEEAYRIYRRIVDKLLKDNTSFREILGIQEEEGIEDFIDRAWHLGVLRSMMERAISIIAAMEPREEFSGYPIPYEIMATYNPRHSWLLGRGGVDLEKILKYILLKEVRERGPKGLREIWRSRWIPSRVKEWMDNKAVDLWNWAEGKKAESLEALIEEVGEINKLIAERMVAVYGADQAVTRVMYWMQRFSLPGVEDRGEWRVEDPIKRAYEDSLRDLLGRDLWENYRQDWEDIARYWGTGFLWDTVKNRVEEEIKESILIYYLGKDYRERSRDSAIKNKFKEILSSDRMYPGFYNLQERKIQISVKEFVERKTWLYKGKLLHMLYKRSPVEFLNIVTRLVPALDNLYVGEGGKLLPTHEVLFEYNYATLKNRLGLEGAKKVLEVRDKIRQEWSGYTLPYLKQIARAWWDLRKNTFELLRKQGTIGSQEGWEGDGRKYKEIIDNKIAEANLLLTRRLLAGKLDDRKLTIEDYVTTKGLDSLTEEEKIIYKVFFDSENEDNIDKHFANINFADGVGQEFMVYDGERDIFTYTVNLWWKRKGKGIPSTIDTDRSEIERYISLSEPRVYERDISDRLLVKEYIDNFISLYKALKHMALNGDDSKLQEVLSAASSYLKGIFGSDFVYETNEVIIEAAAQFHLEHYISRALPFPLDIIARFIIGKQNSISKLIFGKYAYGMSDESVREFVRDMVKKGYIKEEHQKRIEQRLMLADGVYGFKAGSKVLWLMTLVITFYMIKKALEEEMEEKS